MRDSTSHPGYPGITLPLNGYVRDKKCSNSQFGNSTSYINSKAKKAAFKTHRRQIIIANYNNAQMHLQNYR